MLFESLCSDTVRHRPTRIVIKQDITSITAQKKELTSLLFGDETVSNCFCFPSRKGSALIGKQIALQGVNSFR